MSRASLRKIQSPLYRRLKRDHDSIIARRRRPFDSMTTEQRDMAVWTGVASREMPHDVGLAQLMIEIFPPIADAILVTQTDRDQFPDWFFDVLPPGIAAFSILHRTAAAAVFLPWWAEAAPFLADEYSCDGSPAEVWAKTRLSFERAQAIEEPDALKENRK